MKIALGADHAGFALKENIKAFLEELGHEVTDFGAYELDPDDDYPDFVLPAVWAVADGTAERALIFGGSGQGEAMAANRVKGIRAAVFYGGVEDVICLSREHNDANVLSLGARFIGEDEAHHVVGEWLRIAFTKEERHARRNAKLDR